MVSPFIKTDNLQQLPAAFFTAGEYRLLQV